ncbi:FabD/lysophospholipase-like protein [Rhizoclosmatium globosum]|uniref:[acyl-carrier-protein] S-malonyltransferase n=1 Tax=Rhizoclosmatium globosum TaxID=329046 RepID=A0A1Y2CL45_9FUNG|nr:FabD/lysophospholipase-like protein [Rhizoclosmatium globosum]|eukprot:ORY47742.1 FabD/lysophospholipase-like protein [Rhizoclosmatium globosum]
MLRFRPLSTTPIRRTRKTAIIFPGQGSQHVGMGSDIYASFKAAKNVIDECDAAVGGGLRDLMFNGPSSDLTLTANAQPAILCHSIALLRVLQSEFGFDVSKSSFALGHSLGEYTALVATESISLSEAIKLVRLRGEAMQTSVTNKQTSMRALSINKGHLEDIEALMSKIAMIIPEGEIAEIANVNSRSQVVISGSSKGVDYACSVIQAKGFAGRALPLPVSAPFHCSMMNVAAEQMRPALEATKFKTPVIDVISNVTGKPYRPILFDQITKTVQWHRSIEYARDDFVDEWVAIGPSKVLSNLLKREFPVDKVRSISSAKDVEAYGQILQDGSKWEDSYGS